MTTDAQREIQFTSGSVKLEGFFGLPEGARGVVIFAHGSGSGRFSPRNQAVARALREAGLGTLLVDLLTPGESEDRSKVFDIDLLTQRLASATEWLRTQPDAADLSIGYFGASTGAAAALQAAAKDPDIHAVVSRGGRPDLAMTHLPKVTTPTLLIVGGFDIPVIPLNRRAYDLIAGPKKLAIVPGATHLFEEPGALEEVARLAGEWFVKCLS